MMMHSDIVNNQSLNHCSRIVRTCVDKKGHDWLVQIMACHLLGTKPLSAPMLDLYELDPKEYISMESYSKIKMSDSIRKASKCRHHYKLAAILSKPQCD